MIPAVTNAIFAIAYGAWKIQDFNEVWTRDLAIPVRRFNQLRPRPHVSGDFGIRKSFYADTASVHTCPPYTLGVAGDFRICSPGWKFLYTLCIRIRVDARIRIFLYTLTSQYQNQSFSALALLTNPLRCPDTNRIRVDGRIRFVSGHLEYLRIQKSPDMCGRGLSYETSDVGS